jgi:CheY-like chemotaxis protein
MGLQNAVLKAVPGVQVLTIRGDADLRQAIEQGVDLLLLNRQLDYGFSQHTGVELIASLKQSHPAVQAMLVSNYADAQAAAVEAGALPGFGKNDLGTPRVSQMLRDAIGTAAESRQSGR